MPLSAFGNIEYVVNRNARSLRIRISPEGLRVTIPKDSHKENALKFIQQNADKIKLKQNKLKAQNEKIRLDYNKSVQTFDFNFIIREAEVDKIYFRRKGELLTVECPMNYDLNHSDHKSIIWKGISHFLRMDAKRILPEKTLYFAQIYGFTFKDVKIQSSKSRWGSCSAEKNINLSLFLLLLPEHLIDYVILHELCHTIELNHSDKFWDLMNQVTDYKAKNLRAEMKKFNIPA